MRHVFIINPHSGRRDAGRIMLPKISAAAASLGVAAETLTTAAPGDAAAMARDCAKAGQPVRLYAVGGDGTLNEVMAGARGFANAEVAHLPCGSGNDFVRSFGEQTDFLDVESQMRGEAVPIDILEVDGGVCVSIASTGLDANVAYNIPKYRRHAFLGGSMAYNISILEQLLHPLGRRLRVTVDGREQEGRYLIACACNARYYGGGYCAAPVASLNDGLMDVVLVKKMSRLLIASIIGNYKKGRHFENGEIARKYSKWFSHVTAKEVEIAPVDGRGMVVNADGECAPAPRLRAAVLARGARFVLPRHLIKAGAGRL